MLTDTDWSAHSHNSTLKMKNTSLPLLSSFCFFLVLLLCISADVFLLSEELPLKKREEFTFPSTSVHTKVTFSVRKSIRTSMTATHNNRATQSSTKLIVIASDDDDIIRRITNTVAAHSTAQIINLSGILQQQPNVPNHLSFLNPLSCSVSHRMILLDIDALYH